MAVWSDIAEWVGPTDNHSGPMQEYRGLVLHIMQGTYEGSISWAKNPASGVSFHFATAGDGRLGQLLDTGVTAWTQASGNGHWISVENEGFSGNPLTAGQVEACAQVYARGVRDYGWPLQATNDPNGRGLGWHGMGGDAWGGHFDCPGEPIKAQRGAILARAQQILTGTGGFLMALSDEQQDDLYRRVCNIDSAMYYGAAQGGEQLPASEFRLGFGAGEPAKAPVPYALIAKVNELVARPQAGVPTQEQVNAAVKAALLDPAVAKVLADAAFAGSQRAERE